MPWFAAHAVMYFRLKSGVLQGYRVWENILLVEADDSRAAWDVVEDREAETRPSGAAPGSAGPGKVLPAPRSSGSPADYPGTHIGRNFPILFFPKSERNLIAPSLPTDETAKWQT
jgi:hypothetical protein